MTSTDANRHQKVQFGCGLSAPKSWRNFDVSPTLRLQRLPVLGRLFARTISPRFPPNVEVGDIIAGLPISDRSCDAIYCSHVLEHLSLADFRQALSNSFRYLKTDGVFRLVVPDLEILARRYIDSSSATAAHDFLEETRLGVPHRPRSTAERLRQALGNSHHLWMWDYRALALELQINGFRDVRRAIYGDSSSSFFHDIEDRGRWEGAVGVECRR